MSLQGMIAGLTRAGVSFVVMGGPAARAHGSTRITEDLEICYDADGPNVEKLAQLLAGWNAYPRDVAPGLPFIMDAGTLRAAPVLTLTTDQGEIDLCDRVPGLGAYRQARKASVEITAGGVSFRVLSLLALIESKRSTGRPKDRDQIPELEALLELKGRRPS